MKIIADTHCHTIASTHAYSTIMENAEAASKMGLYAIAITDHARTMPGSPEMWYFENLRVIPKKIGNVFILKGVEANILDKHGTLDINEKEEQTLEWVVASIHHPATKLEPNNIKQCTKAMLNIAHDKRVNVIGHSGTQDYKYDYEKVIPEFGKNGKLVEINNASFTVRGNSVPNCTTIAKLCKEYRVPVILNSDSHFCTQIGHVENAIKLLEEIDFPEELIVNADINRFEDYLKTYTKFFNN